jgi:hypothetical protein
MARPLANLSVDAAKSAFPKKKPPLGRRGGASQCGDLSIATGARRAAEAQEVNVMVLNARAKQYRDKANDCDWLASQAQELFVKVSLSDIAGQWRHLANQVEHLEQDRADLKAPKITHLRAAPGDQPKRRK